MSDSTPSTASSGSKLLIRSEVLSVIDFLTKVASVSKKDRQKQLKRLNQLPDQRAVMTILVKELQRTNPFPGEEDTEIIQQTRQVIAELLMELGQIELLQDPLWQLIKDPETCDEVKDVANLILRHLGDNTAPDLYLDYLEDPAGLINRETERMLEVSAENPEALIDFIDFVFSLPVDEQINLLDSLDGDYEPDYLINLYIPLFWAKPPQEVQAFILSHLGHLKTRRSVLFLQYLDKAMKLSQQGTQAGERAIEWRRLIHKSLSELKLAGIANEGDIPELDLPPQTDNLVQLSSRDRNSKNISYGALAEAPPSLVDHDDPNTPKGPAKVLSLEDKLQGRLQPIEEDDNEPDLLSTMETADLQAMVSDALNALEDLSNVKIYCTPEAFHHPITKTSKVYKCYTTLPDGIGNQGIIFSRIQPNGDVTMMTTAVNDLHGVIDCFGFAAISEDDFERIVDKFHEDTCKIEVPATYCLWKLQQAELASLKSDYQRLPYEYICWKVLLDDVPHECWELTEQCRNFAQPHLAELTGSLYHHPDFKTWFIENGDHPDVTSVLEMLPFLLKQAANEAWRTETLMQKMDEVAAKLVDTLMHSSWQRPFIRRLADVAFLLHCQGADTFSSLAATEVMKLLAYTKGEGSDLPLIGFIKIYGRRSIEEELLRLKYSHATLTQPVLPLIHELLQRWQLPALEEV